MKTKAEVLREYPQYKALINAVISRIGLDSVEDVINHGIAGDFSGFTYYSDTYLFAMRNRKNIVDLLENTADMLGEDILGMVRNFGVFRGSSMDSEEEMDLYKYLGGGRPKQGRITNIMAWFTAEEICRLFDE